MDAESKARWERVKSFVWAVLVLATYANAVLGVWTDRALITIGSLLFVFVLLLATSPSAETKK